MVCAVHPRRFQLCAPVPLCALRAAKRALRQPQQRPAVSGAGLRRPGRQRHLYLSGQPAISGRAHRTASDWLPGRRRSWGVRAGAGLRRYPFHRRRRADGGLCHYGAGQPSGRHGARPGNGGTGQRPGGAADAGRRDPARLRGHCPGADGDRLHPGGGCGHRTGFGQRQRAGI